MDLVLNYAYTSRVVLTEANVQALFTAASIFQIPPSKTSVPSTWSVIRPTKFIGSSSLLIIMSSETSEIDLKNTFVKALVCHQRTGVSSADKGPTDKYPRQWWFKCRPGRACLWEYCKVVWTHQNEREVHLPEIFAKCIRFPLMEDTFIEKIPSQKFAQAIAKSCVKGTSQSQWLYTETWNDCTKWSYVSYAAHKHSGKKQTVPCLDIFTGRVFKLCKPPNDLRSWNSCITRIMIFTLQEGTGQGSSEVSIDHKAQKMISGCMTIPPIGGFPNRPCFEPE